MADSWSGLHSQKFRGSIRITSRLRTDTNFFDAEFLYGSKSVGGKRHFPPMYGEPAPGWRPSVKKVAPEDRSRRPQKITDVQCETHKKYRCLQFGQPRSHTHSHAILKTGTNNNLDAVEVRNLEQWEERALKPSRSAETYLLLRAGRSALRSNLLSSLT